MIPHTAIVRHDPPNSYGDCVRACVASMFDYLRVQDVPHFFHDGGGDDNEGMRRLAEWSLATHKVRPFFNAWDGNITINNLFDYMATVNPDIEYLLFCKCHAGDHAVICKNGEIIHDPSLDAALGYKTEINGPASNGLWGIAVFVPDKVNP